MTEMNSLNQRIEAWGRALVNDSGAVFDHVDELFCCGTDPVETVASDFRIVRLPRS